jgi:ArsR family transcriptional regulator, cadmium/lead-responsive transcriptional repressor
VSPEDRLGLIFGALADPTRRQMVQTLLRDGSTSVPALTDQLPITRQAIAKHIGILDHAGLIERSPGRGREVHYRLRAGALAPAASWLVDAEHAWDDRLSRLKRSLEDGA